jgi:hypothetical protein
MPNLIRKHLKMLYSLIVLRLRGIQLVQNGVVVGQTLNIKIVGF